MGGGGGGADAPGGGAPKGGKRGAYGADAEGEEEDTFYDAQKREMAARALRTRAALEELDPAQRVAMEVRAGLLGFWLMVWPRAVIGRV